MNMFTFNYLIQPEKKSSVTMNLLETIREKRFGLLKLAEQRGAFNVRLFGSVVRGEETPCSDVDFLVDMEKGRSLLDLFSLQEDLSKEIDRPVDIITTQSLNRHIKKDILSEAIPL